MIRKSNGSTLLEMAIIVPLILLIVGGTVQFGLGLRDALRLTALASSLGKELADFAIEPNMHANPDTNADLQKVAVCNYLRDSEVVLLNESSYDWSQHPLDVEFFKVVSLNRIFARVTVTRSSGGIARAFGFDRLIRRRGESIVMLTSGASLLLDGRQCHFNA